MKTEYGSVTELNEEAEKLLKADDKKGLMQLAKENGIDSEDAEDYYDGILPEFATARTAALGKLTMKVKELNIEGILKDWVDYIREMLIEGIIEAEQVFSKSLEKCLSNFISYAFENKVEVHDSIVDITKVDVNGKKENMRKPLYLGMPSNRDAKKIIKDYYGR